MSNYNDVAVPLFNAMASTIDSGELLPTDVISTCDRAGCDAFVVNSYESDEAYAAEKDLPPAEGWIVVIDPELDPSVLDEQIIPTGALAFCGWTCLSMFAAMLDGSLVAAKVAGLATAHSFRAAMATAYELRPDEPPTGLAELAAAVNARAGLSRGNDFRGRLASVMELARGAERPGEAADRDTWLPLSEHPGVTADRELSKRLGLQFYPFDGETVHSFELEDGEGYKIDVQADSAAALAKAITASAGNWTYCDGCDICATVRAAVAIATGSGETKGTAPLQKRKPFDFDGI